MISPHVRRLRLAAELRDLRIKAGLTHVQLAKKIGQSRAQISRLENAHLVDQEDVMRILEAIGIKGDKWTEVVTIAREAGERGWWESHRHMGERQALVADLEAGAESIREYQMTFIPGLLQTPGFSRSRAQAERSVIGPGDFRLEQVLKGREGRQRNLRRPGAPHYDVVIDELAIHRLTAPPEVLKEQLYHVTAMVNSHPNVTMRVLQVHARIDEYNVPRSAFSLYTYPDPGDPDVVAVDTVTQDLIFHDADSAARYGELHKQLTKAALPPEESLDFIIDVAKALQL